MKTPGITVRPIVSLDGHHHLNEVFFDDVRVPTGNLVGDEGRGWDVAKYLLANERTGIANVGMARERLAYACELAREITQGGRALIEAPKLRAEIAVLEAEVRGLDLTNWRFLLDPQIATRNPGFASVLKLKGSELHQEISTLLQRIAGPAGVRRYGHEGEAAMHPLAGLTPRYFYFRAATIYGGTSEVQKDILAKALAA
jgi:pimeloyl-CoA dehydrogenase